MIAVDRPIAVDAMGGDHAPAAVVEGALRAAADGIDVLLVGREGEVRAALAATDASEEARARVQVAHADDVVAMDVRPREVKRRETASVRVACRLVAEGRASAVVSAGNSGATLFASVLELGTLPGCDRPAITTTLPRVDGGELVLLDVGASVDCRADHLATFATLGEAWARVLGIDPPRVGLLSIGGEPGKGNRLVREAHPLLEALPLDYVGPVEPDAAFAGACDVLVCDGFSGNVLLKTTEGVVSMLRHHARRRILESRRAQVGAWFMQGALQRLREDLDWRERGGALLVGSPAPVVVAHGRSDAKAVRAAVRLAHYAHDGGLVGAVASRLAPPRDGGAGSTAAVGGASAPSDGP